jgi:membrane protein implicated in regulation of membrane protease activity
MDSWVLWTVVEVALAVGEMLTTGFFLIFFAAGALAAALVALIGAGAVVSSLVFVGASAALLTTVRPLARRHLHTPPQIRTGTAALIGRPAVVLERIANHEGVGCVKIDGEVWTARSFDDDQEIEAGKRVEVLEIRGATALVSE